MFFLSRLQKHLQQSCKLLPHITDTGIINDVKSLLSELVDWNKTLDGSQSHISQCLFLILLDYYSDGVGQEKVASVGQGGGVLSGHHMGGDGGLTAILCVLAVLSVCAWRRPWEPAQRRKFRDIYNRLIQLIIRFFNWVI